MTPNVSTWALSPPRRPSIDDLGGGAKVEDAANPPDPVRDLTADDVNQWQLQLVALNAVIAAARLSVHVGTPPFVNQLVSPIPSLLPGVFTLVRNATGDVSITWPAGTFPAPALDPDAIVTGATSGFANAVAITNGVRVVTKGSTGAPADLPFNVSIY